MDEQADWERTERTAMRYLPYLLLVIGTVITLLQPASASGGLAAPLVLAAVVAGWMSWLVILHPRWTSRSRLMAVYYVGFLLLVGALVVLAPWFGILAFVGYFHAFELLRGPWRFAGVAATAVIMGTSQIGGRPEFTPGGLGSWGVVILVNIVLASALTYFEFRHSEANERRKSDLVELGEANERLGAALAENAGLHAQLLAQAREAGMHDERQRMAREIHDTLAQGLTGIITQLQAAQQAGNQCRHVENAAALARESLAEARRSVHAVRPVALDQAQLPEALGEVARRWSDLTAVCTQVTTTGSARPMHPEVEVALLRTAQEALANVAKHAGASRVGLTLSYMEDLVTLDVRDDGRGFVVNGSAAHGSPDGGYGLLTMRQRVQRVAGRLEIESEPGGGTAVSASVPAIPAGGDGG